MEIEMSTEVLEIHTSTEFSRFQRLNRQTVILDRIQKAKIDRKIVDVFGNFWSICVTKNLPAGQLYLHRHSKKIEIVGTVGVFVPPYSVLEWEIGQFDFQWKAIIVNGKPPARSPETAICFKIDEIDYPETGDQFFKLFNFMREFEEVAKEEKLTPLAFAIKNYLDKHYMESISLNEISKTLGCSLGAMSRSFRNCYGITPVNYRNQLRVFSASLILLQGQKVSDVGYDVGFYDLGRFNKQFKSRMNSVPKQFIPKQNLNRT